MNAAASDRTDDNNTLARDTWEGGHAKQGSTPKTLAATITGWTNNLLATGLLIVIALSGGQWLVSMYRRPAPDAIVDEDRIAQSFTDFQSVGLELGQGRHEMTRTEFQGNREALTDYLVDQCVHHLDTEFEFNSKPGPAESRLLAASTSWTATRADAGNWRVFCQEDATFIPIVIGVDDQAFHPDGKSRLAVVGLAIPKGEDQWTAMVILAGESFAAGRRASTKIEVPVPDFARRTLAISGRDGSHVVGFMATDLNRARQYYEAWAAQNGFRKRGDWFALGGSTQCAFRLPADAGHSQPTTCHVHLIRNANDNLVRGLVTVESDSNHDRQGHEK